MRIILDIKGTDITFDLDEAKKLYNELDKIFGAKTPFWKDWKETKPSYYEDLGWRTPKPDPDWSKWPPMKITCDGK
jgi:hypothetical protein